MPRSSVKTLGQVMTSPSFFSSVSGPTVILSSITNLAYEPYSVNASIANLTKEISELAAAIQRLEATLASLEKQIAEAMPLSPPVRTVSDGDAKKEIKQFFEASHDETLYPSDIADVLNLNYELVERLVWELENEGKIATADPAPRDKPGR
jgi:hypothetical protein